MGTVGRAFVADVKYEDVYLRDYKNLVQVWFATVFILRFMALK